METSGAWFLTQVVREGREQQLPKVYTLAAGGEIVCFALWDSLGVGLSGLWIPVEKKDQRKECGVSVL